MFPIGIRCQNISSALGACVNGTNPQCTIKHDGLELELHIVE